MESQKPHLIYFTQFYGRAELIRMIFYIKKVDYTDGSYGTLEEYMKGVHAGDKQKFEFGQLPVLDFEGKRFSQSIAIARYLAQKYDLMPTDHYQQYLVESAIDGVRDLLELALKLGAIKDPEEKKNSINTAISQTMVPTFAALQKRLLENSSQEYLVGDKLTLIDIALVTIMYSLFWNPIYKHKLGGVLDTLPELRKYIEKRAEDFKEYLETRGEKRFTKWPIEE